MAQRIPTEATRPESLAGRFISRYGIKEYRSQYEKGWRATTNAVYSTGNHTDAYEDGYLDQAAGREKWHLLRCPKHDNSETGCGVA